MQSKPSHFDDLSASELPDSEFESNRPSKTSQKKAMQALQDLGEQLVALSSERVRKMDLPESLRDAVLEAQRMTRHEARRRQLQYVGKVMRTVDPEPIQAQLDIINGLAASETARMHRLERLREALLEDEKCLTQIVEAWPQVDIQYLRTLRRNALKEREQGKPPKCYREIFQVLRQLDEAREVQDDSADTDDENR